MTRSLASCALLLAVLFACGDEPAAPKPDLNPYSISVVGSRDLTGTVGEPAVQQLRVKVMNAAGVGLVGIDVAFSAEQGSLSEAAAKTGSDGVAGVVWTLGTVAGFQNARAQIAVGSVGWRADAEPGQVSKLEWAATLKRVLTLGESVRPVFTATDRFGNPNPGPVALTVNSESRWLGEFSVADTDALALGILEANAPGIVSLKASVGMVETQPVQFTVTAAKPTVFQSIRDGDGMLLRGYGLAGIASAITVDTMKLAAAVLDSATIRVTVPSLSTAGCRGAGMTPLTVGDASVRPGVDLRIRNHRDNELTLAVGQAIRLQPGLSQCLQLPPMDASEYMLAFVDARPIRRALVEIEPYSEGYSDLRMAPDRLAKFFFTDLAAIASASTPSHIALRARETQNAPDMIVTDVSAASLSSADSLPLFTAKTTPWRVGDRGIFRFIAACSETPDCIRSVDEPGTVMRVYGDRIVVVLPDREQARVASNTGWLSSPNGFDAHVPELLTTGIPVLQSVLADGWVQTGATNQIVLIAVSGVANYAYDDGNGSNWAQINLASDGGAVSSRKTIAHELAHLWQMKYTGTDARHPYYYQRTAWAMEGGANFAAREVVRRIRGMSFTDNTQTYATFSNNGPLWAWTQPEDVANTSVFAFQTGYDTSEWLLRVFAHRLVNAGLSVDEAVSAVLRGSLNGWGGLATADATQGLTAIMRNRLGADWDPAFGLLDAFLAIAGDDRNASTVYQVPSLRNTWEFLGPAARITAGGGQSLTLYGGQLAFGYIHITESHGGSYTYGSDLDGVEWMLLRTR
jgi:hypothetical protein